MGRSLSWFSHRIPTESIGVRPPTITKLGYRVVPEGLEMILEITFRFGKSLFNVHLEVLYPSCKIYEMQHFISEPIKRPPSIWEDWEDVRPYIYGFIENMTSHDLHNIIKSSFVELLSEYLENDEELKPFKELFID